MLACIMAISTYQPWFTVLLYPPADLFLAIVPHSQMLSPLLSSDGNQLKPLVSLCLVNLRTIVVLNFFIVPLWLFLHKINNIDKRPFHQSTIVTKVFAESLIKTPTDLVNDPFFVETSPIRSTCYRCDPCMWMLFVATISMLIPGLNVKLSVLTRSIYVSNVAGYPC